jgi:hypothetical protein
MAGLPHYDRSSQHDFLMLHWDRLFGPLRVPKSREVPSDQFRRQWMLGDMLDLVEARRVEITEAEARFRERLRKMANYYGRLTSFSRDKIRADANDKLEYIRPTKRRVLVEAVVDAAMKMRGEED